MGLFLQIIGVIFAIVAIVCGLISIIEGTPDNRPLLLFFVASFFIKLGRSKYKNDKK